MEEKPPMEKWEAKVSTTLTKAKANQIWPLFIDFFNFHKWFPNMSTCYGIHGTNGEVGGTRYCAIISPPNKDGGVEQIIWAKERLVAVNHDKMSMSYELFDCNIGFKSYFSTVHIVSRVDEGCVIEWSFVIEPVEGLTYGDMVQNYQDALDQTTKKMENAIVEKTTDL